MGERGRSSQRWRGLWVPSLLESLVHHGLQISWWWDAVTVLSGGCCRCSVTKSCLTLCDPLNCSTPASLSLTISLSLLQLMSTESVMLSKHLILCRPLLLLPSIFLSTSQVFSNGLVLHIRWPEYWSFNFSISPSNEIVRVDFP